ncbi:MAG: prolipoprotein diacylglyceryl transferase family protein, partial [Anaerolineae bacterium]
MYPAINIGSFVLPTAAFVDLGGGWFILGGGERTARLLKQDPEKMYGTAVSGVVAGLVGARLVFVLLFWSAFRQNLLGIVWPINSGYNLWGGLFFGLAGAFFYARGKRLTPGQTLDVLAPGILLGLITISIADFLAGPGFGTLTRVPWAISQFSMRRHPVQIYEILLGVGVLVT